MKLDVPSNNWRLHHTCFWIDFEGCVTIWVFLAHEDIGSAGCFTRFSRSSCHWHSTKLVRNIWIRTAWVWRDVPITLLDYSKISRRVDNSMLLCNSSIYENILWLLAILLYKHRWSLSHLKTSSITIWCLISREVILLVCRWYSTVGWQVLVVRAHLILV